MFLKVLQCLSCANVTYKIRTKVASHHKFHAPNCNLGRSHASISLFIKGSLVKEFMKLRLMALKVWGLHLQHHDKKEFNQIKNYKYIECNELNLIKLLKLK